MSICHGLTDPHAYLPARGFQSGPSEGDPPTIIQTVFKSGIYSLGLGVASISAFRRFIDLAELQVFGAMELVVASVCF